MNAPTESARAAGSADDDTTQTFLLVGSRVNDDVFIAPRPGRPGFFGSPGSLQTYRFSPDRVHPLDTVSDSIRVGGSLVDPNRGVIHVLHEVSANSSFYPQAMRGGGGDVLTYRIETDGRLRLIDRTLAFGARPANLSFAAGNHFVLSVNLGGGGDGAGPCTTAEFDADGHLYPRIHTTERSVVCRRCNGDGTLGDVVDVLTSDSSFTRGFVALGRNPADDRQIASCSHDGSVRLVRIDPRTGRLAEELAFDLTGEQQVIGSAGGSVAFHPHGRWLYARRGLSRRISVVDCLAAEPPGTFNAAAGAVSATDSGPPQADLGFERQTIVASADGRHLYVVLSEGAVSVLEISTATGRATWIQIVRHPPGASAGCGIDLSPDGRHLAVPCPDSGEVLIFDVGPDGRVSYRFRLDQASAAHARFYRVAPEPADRPHRG